MYEQYGFTRAPSGEQSITLFIPDNPIDATQYTRGDGIWLRGSESHHNQYLAVASPSEFYENAETSLGAAATSVCATAGSSELSCEAVIFCGRRPRHEQHVLPAPPY